MDVSLVLEVLCGAGAGEMTKDERGGKSVKMGFAIGEQSRRAEYIINILSCIGKLLFSAQVKVFLCS